MFCSVCLSLFLSHARARTHISHCERWSLLCLLTPNQMISLQLCHFRCEMEFAGLFYSESISLTVRFTNSQIEFTCSQIMFVRIEADSPAVQRALGRDLREPRAWIGKRTTLNFILYYLPNCVCSFEDGWISTFSCVIEHPSRNCTECLFFLRLGITSLVKCHLKLTPLLLCESSVTINPRHDFSYATLQT